LRRGHAIRLERIFMNRRTMLKDAELIKRLRELGRSGRKKMIEKRLHRKLAKT
jgi:hypothetical protein